MENELRAGVVQLRFRKVFLRLVVQNDGCLRCLKIKTLSSILHFFCISLYFLLCFIALFGRGIISISAHFFNIFPCVIVVTVINSHTCIYFFCKRGSLYLIAAIRFAMDLLDHFIGSTISFPSSSPYIFPVIFLYL